MANSEWTLIFFTLIVQMCVGAFFFQEILLPQTIHNNPDLQKRKYRMLLALLALMIIAVFLSFFHLGKPGNAIYSFNNLRDSWLSREILMLSFFTVLLSLTAFISRRNPGKSILLRFISILTMIAGWVLIYNMAMIYMMKTIPVWNSVTTMVEFISCSLILGGMLFVLFSGRMMQEEYLFKRINILLLIIIILLVADISNSVYLFLQYRELEILQDLPPELSIIKTILQITAILVLLFQFRSLRQNKKLVQIWIIIVFVVILISEIVGRYAFYASYVSPGV
jgi:anaerobic dimethyl sulfoxide reductase subunit C (anchor subunit)